MPILGSWSELMLKTADRYVVVSRSGIDEMIRWGVPPHRITFITNGIPTGQYPRAPFVSAPVLLCPARLREEKNHVGLLRVLAALCRGVPGGERWLVGDGPMEGGLRTRRSDLASRVARRSSATWRTTVLCARSADYTASFKSKVALRALRGRQTGAEFDAKHEAQPAGAMCLMPPRLHFAASTAIRIRFRSFHRGLRP
jgi:glycosyltransferase involved in cell wall biosynthesis